jgi:hypothetical protein
MTEGLTAIAKNGETHFLDTLIRFGTITKSLTVKKRIMHRSAAGLPFPPAKDGAGGTKNGFCFAVRPACIIFASLNK